MSEWVSMPTSGYGGLTQLEMDNNASIVYGLLYADGWELEAICGVLGNMSVESGLNPQAWQGSIGNTYLGFGLVQWTPATKLITWCNSHGYNYKDGSAQCYRIKYEMVSGIQYIETESYPLAASDYKSSTQTPEYLTKAWFANYERGNTDSANMSARIEFAEHYYTLFSGEEPPEPPPGPSGGGALSVPVWLLFKM